MSELEKRITFIKEIDKLKEIKRNSYLLSQSRKENSAEHSWHISLLAIILIDYCNDKVDILKVLKMILIHDIVEIDAGDVLVYNDSKEILAAKKERETKSAKRIFGLLPLDQQDELTSLWEEFENEESAESRYAAALDRIMPLLHNIYSEGRSWKENNISLEQVLNKNVKIKINCPAIWDYLEPLIVKAFKNR